MKVGNAARLAALVAAAVLAPPPPVDLNAWAAQKGNVTFGNESPFPGPYDPDRFPMFRRILDVLGPDHPAREVTLLKSAQGGGTVIAQIFVAGSLTLDPGPVLYTHPTEPNAIRWVKTKWKPFLRGCSSLSSQFSSGTSRDAKNSTLYMERRDGLGHLLVSGANSEASLSMISMPRQVQDDLAKWETNNAGDSEVQADSRSAAFEWAKIAKIGTPLLADNCRITRAFKRGTQEHWYVPCPHCGHEQVLDWDNMLAGLDPEAPELAHFSCIGCGGLIEERHRDEMNSRGHWIAHNPGAAQPSFYFWSAQLPFRRWASIAADWVKAKGDPAAEQAFLNDVIGRAYQTQGEAPAWEGLRDRATAAERRAGIVPRGAALLTMGLDCQDGWIAWHLVGWGRELRRAVVQYGVVPGSINEEPTIRALDDLVRSRWRDFQGGSRTVDLVAIDGNAWTNDVLEWVKRHPIARSSNPPGAGVLMVRGARGDAAPALAKVKVERGRDGKLRRYGGRFFNVGVSGLKFALYKHLHTADPLQRGFVDLPAGLEDEYFVQLTAERRQLVKRKDGFAEYRWVKPSALRNEALDTMLYAEAAAIRLGWKTKSDADWDRLEAELEAPPEAPQLDLEEAGPPPMPLVHAPRRARRIGVVGGLA